MSQKHRSTQYYTVCLCNNYNQKLY